MLLVAEYLKLRKVPFEVISHRRAFTSIAEARALGVSADEVLKTLVVDRHQGHALLVIPGSRRVDMRLVRRAVGDPHAHLATEAEIQHDFTGYELGAMPPLGSLVGAQTFVDPAVLLHDTVVFAAGSQTESIKARTEELFKEEPITVVPLMMNGADQEKPDVR